MSDHLFEDLRWREENRHHPGLGRVGISLGEGNHIAFALETTLSNIRGLAKPQTKPKKAK